MESDAVPIEPPYQPFGTKMWYLVGFIPQERYCPKTVPHAGVPQIINQASILKNKKNKKTSIHPPRDPRAIKGFLFLRLELVKM